MWQPRILYGQDDEPRVVKAIGEGLGRRLEENGTKGEKEDGKRDFELHLRRYCREKFFYKL